MDSTIHFGQTTGFGELGRENDRDGSMREIHLSDGNTVTVESRDPYGHWYVKWYKGSPPAELEGTYTSAEHAINAVKAYVGNEKYAKVVTEKVEKAPPILYKKPREAVV